MVICYRQPSETNIVYINWTTRSNGILLHNYMIKDTKKCVANSVYGSGMASYKKRHLS